MNGRSRKCLIFAATQFFLGISFGASLRAQVLGPEFAVNSYTSGHQVVPLTAPAVDGGFLVVWSTYNGPTYDVRGRLFGPSGSPETGDFPVNVSTTRDELGRSVAVDEDGTFLVVWEAFDESDQIVMARAFDTSGAPLGDEFVVHADTSALFFQPDVAAIAPDEFIVAWQALGRDSVWARLVGPSAPLGPAFQVNTYATGEHDYPVVASDGNDGFVVAWESHRPGGGPSRIFAQRFDALGNPQGDELQLSTVTTDSEWNVAIAKDPAGGFVVAWESWARDDSAPGIFARRFDSVGSPIGDDFRVDSATTGSNRYPSVGSAENGDFLVVWTNDAQDGSESGIFGQHLDAAGIRVGEEFRVNTYTTGAQAEGAVAGLSGGGFVVAWSSMEQDGSNSGIFGQRLQVRGFADGFESGDACAWSATSGGGCL